MAVDFSVSGTIELCPPVPLAQLWELFHNGRFEVAPHGATEVALTALLRRAHWLLVPDADSGTDEQGRPKTIRYLRVQDPGIGSWGINERLRDLSALMGAAHEFDGELRFSGDVEGEAGTIEPYEDGELPEWHETGGRSW
ncbi:hypothetical protein [Streptomyces syringium]|uniref:hypothetical protein n=1 Tax=Streptomyces syringium TaxID=76729 RepID=UPI003AAA6B13